MVCFFLKNWQTRSFPWKNILIAVHKQGQLEGLIFLKLMVDMISVEKQIKGSKQIKREDRTPKYIYTNMGEALMLQK